MKVINVQKKKNEKGEDFKKIWKRVRQFSKRAVKEEVNTSGRWEEV